MIFVSSGICSPFFQYHVGRQSLEHIIISIIIVVAITMIVIFKNPH